VLERIMPSPADPLPLPAVPARAAAFA
jgi:hypothetical protein